MVPNTVLYYLSLPVVLIAFVLDRNNHTDTMMKLPSLRDQKDIFEFDRVRSARARRELILKIRAYIILVKKVP